MDNNNLLHEHLYTYVKDQMQQKFRLDLTIEEYEKLEVKLRERIIDQKDLIGLLNSEHHSTEQMNLLQARQNSDTSLRTDVQNVLSQYKEKRQQLIDELQAHLMELAEMEIQNGGFFAHIITTDTGKYDENTKIVKLEQQGHIEIPIATYLDKWKDSSQLRIIPVKTS